MAPWAPAVARHAPAKAPMTMRAISPGGAVRLGVFGSLSVVSSTRASTLKTATAGTVPIQESRRGSLSQHRCAPQAVAAGGVRERRPASSPLRTGKTTVILATPPGRHFPETYEI